MARRPRLFVTRGLPGSGKTTAARKLVEEHIHRRPDGKIRAIDVSRCNRDMFRAMMHGSRLGSPVQEELVTVSQNAMIRALLAAGKDVVVDDTNLYDNRIREFHRMAAEYGADCVVIDLRAVPLEECIARDATREGPARVGEKVIRELHDRHIARGIAAAAVNATARSLGVAR